MTSIATTERQKELAKLPVGRIQDVLLARMIARQEAARMGFGPQALTQIATAVSEITRNVVQHAGVAGEVRMSELFENERRGLQISVEDAGKGIGNVEHVLSGTSPGAGIPGCQRLMDRFSMHSSAGSGTLVIMVKWFAC